MHGTERPVTTASDLAHRPALRLGNLSVDPATRRIDGPGGQCVLRPQVMLVLLTLIDAQGGVVTRDELVERAWRRGSLENSGFR